jgi:hypothetical protein
MKKLLYPLGVLAAALAMFGSTATPALAHSVDVYHGSRAHGWTNGAHTRVAIQDTLADGRWVRLDVLAGGQWYVDYLRDFNDSDPGYSSKPAPAGRVLHQIRACAENTGCTARPVT